MGREFDGISVDGKSVEEYLMEDEPEVLEADKISPKRKERVKFMETKEKSGPVITRRQQIISVLCENPSVPLTTKMIQDIVDMPQQTDVSKIMASIWKSRLAHHMTRSGSPKAGGYKYILQEQMDLHRAIKLAGQPKRKIDTPPKPKLPTKKPTVTQDVDLNINVHITFTFSVKEGKP